MTTAFNYCIWLALMEKAAFRSYPFLKLKDNLGLFAALYHFAIGWDLQTVLMGPFVWGGFMDWQPSGRAE